MTRGGKRDDRSALPGRLQLVRLARQEVTEAARRLRRESTRSERLMWEALRGGQLDGFKFRRQHPIGPFVVDFFCASAGLILEIDGAIHSSREAGDRERQLLLESRDYRVLRFSAEEVENDLGRVLQRVAEALTQAG